MALEIMRDPRVRSVEWRDLLELSTWEIVKEILLSLPWIATSLVLAQQGWYLIALPFSFIFFLCGLRQVHNAYHYAVGISRPATEWMMFILSCMMQSSMHALQQTHLHHHSHCMDDEDAEAASARMKGWQAILFGPYFYYLIHRKGIELANPRQRRWILAEFVTISVWVYFALAVCVDLRDVRVVQRLGDRQLPGVPVDRFAPVVRICLGGLREAPERYFAAGCLLLGGIDLPQGSDSQHRKGLVPL